MAAHGVPRATGDLDVWIQPDEDNAGRVWEALIAFGAPVQTLGLSQADLVARAVAIKAWCSMASHPGALS